MTTIERLTEEYARAKLRQVRATEELTDATREACDAADRLATAVLEARGVSVGLRKIVGKSFFTCTVRV